MTRQEFLDQVLSPLGRLTGQGALREEKQAWERYSGAVNDVLRGGAEAEPV